MTHKEAMQLIRENLEQDAYTYDHLVEMYVQFREHEPDFDLNRQVKGQIEKLALDFPHWWGEDGQEWFGEEA